MCYRCERLCSGTCTATAQVSLFINGGWEDACYLRCEPPVQVSAQVARANGQTGANGGDFGYRTAMAFIVETAQKGTFRLRSELTGGYVNVGGLFQRYCLCASAPTAAEATSFEFVARQKDGE